MTHHHDCDIFSASPPRLLPSNAGTPVYQCGIYMAPLDISCWSALSDSPSFFLLISVTNG